MTSELTAVEREAQLSRLWKQLRKAGRGGDRVEYERLSALYAARKAEAMEEAEEELRAAVRAQRAAVRAQAARVRPARWRLPYGFSSPLAAERARSGWRAREEPTVPAGGLRPWRLGSLMETRIWRP